MSVATARSIQLVLRCGLIKGGNGITLNLAHPLIFTGLASLLESYEAVAVESAAVRSISAQRCDLYRLADKQIILYCHERDKILSVCKAPYIIYSRAIIKLLLGLWTKCFSLAVVCRHQAGGKCTVHTFWNASKYIISIVKKLSRERDTNCRHYGNYMPTQYAYTCTVLNI